LPGAHGAFGVVLVGLRMAEVDQQPVAEVLRDVAGLALDRLGRGLLIGAHDAAQVFWVEALREIGRAPRSQNITLSWRRSASGAAFIEGATAGASAAPIHERALPSRAATCCTSTSSSMSCSSPSSSRSNSRWRPPSEMRPCSHK
jgi:hypothetical protein